MYNAELAINLKKIIKNLFFVVTSFLSISPSAQENLPDFKLFNLTEFSSAYILIQNMNNKSNKE